MIDARSDTRRVYGGPQPSERSVYDPPTHRIGQDSTESARAKIVRGVADAAGIGQDSTEPPGPLGLGGRLAKFPELFELDYTSADWLVEGFLARGRAHALFTAPGQAKSLFALWGAVELLRRGHAVIYLDFEMVEADLADRLDSMGAGPDTDLSRLAYWFLSGDSLPPLDTAAGGERLLAYVDHVRAELPEGVELVVILDTFGRAVEGEESSNDTAIRFDRHTGRKLTARGVTWVRLDHTGHGDQDHARVGSAKRGDVGIDWQMTYSESSGLVTLTARKRRYAWVPAVCWFDRHEDPELHWVYRGTWTTPPEARELADLLDRLGVPNGWGRDRIRKRLREAGVTAARNDVLSAAIAWRKHQAERAENLSRTGSTSTPKNPTAKARDRCGDRWGQVIRDGLGTGLSPLGRQPGQSRPDTAPEWSHRDRDAPHADGACSRRALSVRDNGRGWRASARVGSPNSSWSSPSGPPWRQSARTA